VAQVSVGNMDTLLSKLYFAIDEKLKTGNISFIVMSYKTADSLCKEILNSAGIRLKYFNGYEVLLSESLKFSEFRIG